MGNFQKLKKKLQITSDKNLDRLLFDLRLSCIKVKQTDIKNIKRIIKINQRKIRFISNRLNRELFDRNYDMMTPEDETRSTLRRIPINDEGEFCDIVENTEVFTDFFEVETPNSKGEYIYVDIDFYISTRGLRCISYLNNLYSYEDELFDKLFMLSTGIYDDKCSLNKFFRRSLIYAGFHHVFPYPVMENILLFVL